MGRLLQLVVAAVILTGCDNTIDPYTSSAGEQYAVYGYLDSEADTQFVRVVPVIDATGFDYQESLGVQVELLDLRSGELIRLQDSSVALGIDRRAYIYYTAQKPSAGSEYRLDVFSPQRDTTSVFTKMPGVDQVDMQNPEPNITGQLIQRVAWTAVSSVRDVRVHYQVRTTSDVEVVSRSYSSPTQARPYVTIIELDRDSRFVFDELFPNRDDSTGVALLGVSISAELRSPEWASADEHGTTFFGSVGRVEKTWILPDSVITRLGYIVP